MGVYLKDQEIAREIGMPLGEWAVAAAILEKHGLPRRDPPFGDRRHWPAVQEWLHKRATGANPTVAGQVENYNGFGKRNARPQKAPEQGRIVAPLLDGEPNGNVTRLHPDRRPSPRV